MTADGPTPTWPDQVGEMAWCQNCWAHILWDGVQWRHEGSGTLECNLRAEPAS